MHFLTLNESKEFTREGKRTRQVELGKAALSEIDKLQLSDYGRGASEAIMQTMQKSKTDRSGVKPSETRLLDYLKQREIRDLLAPRDPLTLEADYLTAVQTGSNQRLVDAVEASMEINPLVSQAVIDKGRQPA